jgi:hypothetical protein
MIESFNKSLSSGICNSTDGLTPTATNEKLADSTKIPPNDLKDFLSIS